MATSDYNINLHTVKSRYIQLYVLICLFRGLNFSPCPFLLSCGAMRCSVKTTDNNAKQRLLLIGPVNAITSHMWLGGPRLRIVAVNIRILIRRKPLLLLRLLNKHTDGHEKQTSNNDLLPCCFFVYTWGRNVTAYRSSGWFYDSLQMTMAIIATCPQVDSGLCIITAKGAACESCVFCHLSCWMVHWLLAVFWNRSPWSDIEPVRELTGMILLVLCF